MRMEARETSATMTNAMPIPFIFSGWIDPEYGFSWLSVPPLESPEYSLESVLLFPILSASVISSGLGVVLN